MGDLNGLDLLMSAPLMVSALEGVSLKLEKNGRTTTTVAMNK